MFWRPLVLRLLAVVMVVGVALTAAPAPAATPSEVKRGTQVLQLVNAVRADHDKGRLRRHRCLQKLAARQAQRMADQRRMFHQDLSNIWKTCGGTTVAENVAYTPAGPLSLVTLWLNSLPHRKNILWKFRLTGVAVRKGGDYWYASQVFQRK